MKLENQVCSLDQGKILKELGVQGEALFSWFGNEKILNLDRNDDGMELNTWVFVSSTVPVNNMQEEHRYDISQETPICPAFTVAELGVMLPSTMPYEEHIIMRMDSGPWIENNGYSCGYIEVMADYDMGAYIYSKSGKTEAQARAAMLIYLLEEGLITATEVNQRLNNA